MTQEHDPFVEGGEDDESLIMAPLLVEKLQVSQGPDNSYQCF